MADVKETKPVLPTPLAEQPVAQDAMTDGTDKKPVLPTPLAEQPVAQENQRGSKHTCSVCSKGFLYTSMLEKHVKEQHSIVKKEKEDGDVSKHGLCCKSLWSVPGLSHWQPIRTERCPTCDFQSYSKKALALHRRTHQLLHSCGTCEQQFERKGDLVQHEKIHGTRCKSCDFRSHIREVLALHKRTHHPLRKYSCGTCEEQFDRKSDFVQHEKTHGRRCQICGTRSPGSQCVPCFERRKQQPPRLHKCRFCGWAFSQKTSMLRHEERHSKAKTCSVCEKTFRMGKSLLKHAISHVGEEPPFSCPVCRSTDFAAREDVLSHLCTHGGKESDLHRFTREKPIIKSHSCGQCGKKFRYRSGLRLHELTHSGVKEHVCPICERRFSLKGVLKAHLRLHTGERPHVCDVCQKAFAFRASLCAHERSHTGERPYACDVCKKTFAVSATLRNHKATCHEGKRRKTGKGTVSKRRKSAKCPTSCPQGEETDGGVSRARGRQRKGRHKCHHCPYSCKDSRRISEHLESHLGLQSYRCEVCAQAFTHRNGLRKHRALQHSSGEFRHPCPHCDMGFVVPFKLKQHIRSRHPDKQLPQEKEVFKCLECRKSFKSALGLRAHRRVQGHWREGPRAEYRCPHCPYSAGASASRLAIHLRVHTGERPFACSLCPKTFAIKSTLTGHLRTHTGERPCVCDSCGKGFSTNTVLRQHVRRVHEGEPLEQRHLCSDKVYTRHSSLVVHLRSHTGERPFVCATCGKDYMQSADLAKHRRTTHTPLIRLE